MITYLKLHVLNKIFPTVKKRQINPLFSKQQTLYALIIHQTLSVSKIAFLVQIQLMFPQLITYKTM